VGSGVNERRPKLLNLLADPRPEARASASRRGTRHVGQTRVCCGGAPGAAAANTSTLSRVNVVLHNLLSSLHAILGAQLAGRYLVGSLALGDFDPQDSDLDLLIVTVGTLSDETVAALRDLHQRLDHSPSAWAARLDAAYIPQDALPEASLSAAPARYPILEWPELLVLGHLESGG
jgi:hypothetical protein